MRRIQLMSSMAMLLSGLVISALFVRDNGRAHAQEVPASPWSGQVEDIGTSSLALANQALAELASGDNARAGASVFSLIDYVIDNQASTSSATKVTLTSLLSQMTVNMENILTLVQDPLTLTPSDELLALFESMDVGQAYMVNKYSLFEKYTPRDIYEKPTAADLKAVLLAGDVEKPFRDAASGLIAYGPEAIPAALVAVAQHIGVLQEQFFLGDKVYRYVVRKYAAQYYEQLSVTGNLISLFVSDLFDKARQNYPDSTYTLQLDNSTADIVFISSDEDKGINVSLSRSNLTALLGSDQWQLCTEATSNSTCGIVTNATSYTYLVHSLVFLNSFGDAIQSLDALRGYGNLDEISSRCVGCSVSLSDALEANLASGKSTNQSSTSKGFPASLAADGNDGLPAGIPTSATCSQTDTNGTSDPWWRVDLGSSQTVTSVHLFNRQDCCQEEINGAEVWVGNSADTWDGSNARCTYVSLPFWSLGTNGKSSPVSIVCSGVSGQYVWVHLPGSNRVLTLCEVLVLGSFNTTAAYPPPSGSDPSPVSACLATVSPGGQCGASTSAFCCPSLTPCCGSTGVCGNSTASCGTGCEALYSYGSLCSLST